MTNRLTRAELLRRGALGSAAVATPGLFAGTARGGTRRPVRVQANGNKPPAKPQTAFTRRVMAFERVAYYPLGGTGSAAVAMVIDEILVSPTAAKVLSSFFEKRKVAYTNKTVFDGLEFPQTEDVQIWRLEATPGTGPDPDVAALVWDARNVLRDYNRNNPKQVISVQQVAPNHVLIPSSNPLFNYHTCPGGPPEETTVVRTLPPRRQRPVDVVVIDSGYVSEGQIVPLIEQPQKPLERGQWFTATSDPTQPFLWIEEPDEPGGPSYVTVPGNRLATLVGHANFVAGVIAQACRGAQITLVNHNGGFIEHVHVDKPISTDVDTPISTEASVARSLWTHRGAEVINVGYAFATLPNAALLDNTVDRSGPPSWTFQLVLNQIRNANKRNPKKTTVVVAPAGNQSCPTRQYPAAFHAMYPFVIGVASISKARKLSWFSNYGKWVTCCTQGEGVLSTFITDWQEKPTEEAEPPHSPHPGTRPQKTFESGWASWSGTSFAAPKVSAAIANRVGSGRSSLDAWGALKQGRPVSQMMGVVLSGLPPTP